MPNLKRSGIQVPIKNPGIEMVDGVTYEECVCGASKRECQTELGEKHTFLRARTSNRKPKRRCT